MTRRIEIFQMTEHTYGLDREAKPVFRGTVEQAKDFIQKHPPGPGLYDNLFEADEIRVIKKGKEYKRRSISLESLKG